MTPYSTSCQSPETKDWQEECKKSERGDIQILIVQLRGKMNKKRILSRDFSGTISSEVIVVTWPI